MDTVPKKNRRLWIGISTIVFVGLGVLFYFLWLPSIMPDIQIEDEPSPEILEAARRQLKQWRLATAMTLQGVFRSHQDGIVSITVREEVVVNGETFINYITKEAYLTDDSFIKRLAPSPDDESQINEVPEEIDNIGKDEQVILYVTEDHELPPGLRIEGILVMYEHR
jgi:hypothetical protein